MKLWLQRIRLWLMSKLATGLEQPEPVACPYCGKLDVMEQQTIWRYWMGGGMFRTKHGAQLVCFRCRGEFGLTKHGLIKGGDPEQRAATTAPEPEDIVDGGTVPWTPGR